MALFALQNSSVSPLPCVLEFSTTHFFHAPPSYSFPSPFHSSFFTAFFPLLTFRPSYSLAHCLPSSVPLTSRNSVAARPGLEAGMRVSFAAAPCRFGPEAEEERGTDAEEEEEEERRARRGSTGESPYTSLEVHERQY